MNILDQIDAVRNDPTRIQQVVLNAVDAFRTGELTIPHPGNPFSLLLEMAASVAASTSIRDSLALRAMYPILAQTQEDLYRHMADVDYLGRFATPSELYIRLMFAKGELIQLAQTVPGTNIRKLIIPRHSKVLINDVEFTLSYPIEIRVMAHGGLTIVYDTVVENDLGPLETNLVDWNETNLAGTVYVQIVAKFQQYKLAVKHDTLSNTTGFNKSYDLVDSFYYCRVYGVYSDGSRKQIKTTHSDQVYDPKVPTALLTVENNRLAVEIPQVYFNRGLLPGGVDIEILTTKGELAMTTVDFPANAFVMTWGDSYNEVGDATYSAPLTSVAQWQVWSDDVTTGGTNGLTFEALRERTIANANQTNLPITDAQLAARLQLRGYDIILSLDNVVRRVYLATRRLEAGSSGFTTGAGCVIDTLTTSYTELVALPTVVNNGDRITITPGTLFKYGNGLPKVMSTYDLATLNALPTDRRIATINAGGYAYTPLHYVLDVTNKAFDLRPYYLDDPLLEARRFIQENDTLQLFVSTLRYRAFRDSRGFVIQAVTESDEAYKAIPAENLHAQLYFKPVNESDLAYLNGELVGTLDGEFVWEFVIETRLDITRDDHLFLDNFTMYTTDPKSFRAELSHTFGIVYAVSDYDIAGSVASEIDNVLGSHVLPLSARGLTHEQFSLQFGYSLKQLWSNARTVAGSLTFATHDRDIPMTYPSTVFVKENGQPVLTLDADGKPQYQVLHRKGDPVIVDGEIQYLFRKGDVIVDDETGEPVAVENRQTLRQIDLLFVDGVYHFATAEKDRVYKATIPEMVVNYLRKDLAALQPVLLERTSMYLWPKRTLGPVTIITKDGQKTTIPAGLEFKVTFYLTPENYVNDELRTALTATTRRIINDTLLQAQVGTDDIIVAIKAAVDKDIVAVAVDNLGPNKDIPAYTAIDEATRCTVRRRLRARADGTLGIDEAIDIDFIRHVV